MSETGIVISEIGAVRLVELNRPGAKNRIDDAMHEALATVWDELAADANARAIVLTGRGDVFCGGGDLEMLEEMVDDLALAERGLARDQVIMRGLRNCRLPVVAAVNGPAVGLGCSLALHCDLVLMADTAYLADPHVALGLAAGDGGAAMLPTLVPLMRAKQFLFLGDKLRAAEAVALGAAIEAVPASELRSRALALAERLAAQPPGALQFTKSAINAHLAPAVAAGELAYLAEVATIRSPEFAAAMGALLERMALRRAPTEQC
jgi:enoyl-CoA hydratase